MKNLLDNETKVKISELASKIDQLSIEFQKEDYPYEQLNKETKRFKS